IHYQLPGFVSQTVSDLLLRPVEVGPVQSVGLTELKLGESRVLPRPEDPDSAIAQEVIARWNLWAILNPFNLLGDRIIPIELEFRDATVYVEQSTDGSLLDLTLAEAGEKGPVEIQVAKVSAYNADVKVIPAAFDRSPTGAAGSNEPVIPILLGVEAAEASLEDWTEGSPQTIDFDTRGTLAVDGIDPKEWSAEGGFKGETQQVLAGLRGADLPLDAIAQLAPGPIQVASGVGSGNLSVEYTLDGAWPTVQGTAQVEDLQVDGELLPRSLRVNEGVFRFAEQAVTVDTLRTRYGDVSARVKGTVDLAESQLVVTDPQGSELEAAFDLTVNAPDVGMGELQDTFGLELPVALSGLVGAEARLTGTIDDPQVTGQVEALGPLQVDQLEIETLTAGFSLRSQGSETQDSESQASDNPTIQSAALSPGQAGGGAVNRRLDKLPERLAAVFPVEASLKNLRIVPATGGEIVGDATVLLRDRGQLEAMEIGGIEGVLNLRSLNLNNVAQVYGAPTTVGLGLLSGQVSVDGFWDDWQSRGKLSLLGGDVNLTGDGSQNNFASQVNWSGIDLQRVASLLPEEVRRQVRGNLAGRAQVSGTLGEDPAIAAQVRTGWAGGTITADGNLRGEQWQAIARVQNANLTSLLPRYGGMLSANAQASGDLLALSGDLNSIRAQVTSSLKRFAGGDVDATATLVQGQWQATVQTQDIQLARLVPEATGRWTGAVTAMGPLAALTALD
ncbi:MAG: hypothetical protein AAGF75_06470, partial [Cyanobacteria bacterium P01_H01_bin.130]